MRNMTSGALFAAACLQGLCTVASALESASSQAASTTALAYHLELQMFSLVLSGLPERGDLSVGVREFVRNGDGEFVPSDRITLRRGFGNWKIARQADLVLILGKDGTATLSMMGSISRFDFDPALLETYRSRYPAGLVRGNQVVLMDLAEDDEMRTGTFDGIVSYVAIVIEDRL